PDIVRAVQTLPSVLADKHGDRAVRSDGPEFVLLVGARNQMAGKIEIHAVGATRWLQEGGESPIHAPLQDAIVRFISEEHAATSLTRRSLGEVKITSQFLQAGAWGDHMGSGFARAVLHNDLRAAMNTKSRIDSIDIKASAVTYELEISRPCTVHCS